MSGNQADIPASAPDTGEPDDFDAALAEFAGEADAPAVAAGTSPEDKAPPQPEAPAPEAGDQGQSAAEQAPTGEPTGDDPLSGVPESVRAEIDKLKREVATISGRAAAEARRANALERQLASGTQPAGTPASGQPSNGNGPTTAEEARDVLESDDMKRLKEDYPEIAGPIVAALQRLEARTQELAVPVQNLAAQQQSLEVDQRYAALAEKHPDWQTYATDQRWGAFLNEQPRFVQEMFARNVDVSDPEEAAFVLTRFKEYIGVKTPPASTEPAPANTEVQRRQRQLDAARDGGTSGAGATVTGIPDDFDAAMAAYAKT